MELVGRGWREQARIARPARGRAWRRGRLRCEPRALSGLARGAPGGATNRSRRAAPGMAAGRVPVRTGPVHYVGSYVSGLMVWRDLDVMVLVPPGFGPTDVVGLLAELVELPGVAGFDVHDERGPRSPTGQRRDERWHVPLMTGPASGAWRLDLTLWLYDDHTHLTRWHEELRGRLTPEQRAAILWIKSAWHCRPEYRTPWAGRTSTHRCSRAASGRRRSSAYISWPRRATVLGQGTLWARPRSWQSLRTTPPCQGWSLLRGVATRTRA